MATSTNNVAYREAVIKTLLAELNAAGITTPTEQAMILGQLDHESGGFMRMEENLNYSVDGMLKVSKTARTKGRAAVEAAVKQGKQAIAELMYGGRMGNVNPGDGWKFRGRGYIQLTGRENYTKFSKFSGVDAVNNPDLLLQPVNAAKAAIWFWKTFVGSKGKNGDVKATTLAINGGTLGLDDRMAKYNKYLARLNGGTNVSNIA